MSEFLKWPGFTVFCEDVRHEVGGKMTACGIYQDFVGITQDDLFLPKFVALNFLHLPDVPAGTPVTVEVSTGQAKLVETTLPSPPNWSADVPGFEGVQRRSISMPIEMTPFSVKAGMAIQVTVRVGNWEYKSHPLPIIKAQTPVPR